MLSDWTKGKSWGRQGCSWGRKKGNSDQTWRKYIWCAKSYKHSTRYDESIDACKLGVEYKGCRIRKFEITKGFTKEWTKTWKGIYWQVEQT